MSSLTFHTYPLPLAATFLPSSAAATTQPAAPSSSLRLIVAAQGEDSDDDGFDCNFFDPDYSIAAQTAFSVWEGAAFLLQFLQRVPDAGLQGSHVAAALRTLLQLNTHGEPAASVVELGSGTGAAGIGLAMLGASVLCTDIASVTPNIRDNIQRNAGGDGAASVAAVDQGGTWLGSLATPVGFGSAAAQPLNWTVPLASQCSPVDPRAARVVLATETTWLRELVDPFVECATQLLGNPYPAAAPPPPQAAAAAATKEAEWPPIVHYLHAKQPTRKFLLWVYKERGTQASQTFTTWPLVKGEFEKRGCKVVTVHREQSGEDEGQWVRVNVVVKTQSGDELEQWE